MVTVLAELAVALLRGKAGPKGDRARKALRAWRLLRDTAKARGLMAGGLPACAALVADIVRGELERAQREATGSQGGNTVGGTVRDGFLWLQEVAAQPIDAKNALVEAAAQAEAGDTPNDVRHAGTLPIAVQCAFEEVAVEKQWSVHRTIARSLLCTVFAHHIRCNDALNTRIFHADLAEAIDRPGGAAWRGGAVPLNAEGARGARRAALDRQHVGEGSASAWVLGEAR